MTSTSQDHQVKPIFDAASIERRIDELAGEIAAQIHTDIVVVGLLKGSFIFVADLVRAMDKMGMHPRVEFLRLSSYGSAKESSGEVHLIGDIPTDLAGRSILLVDDIADTGRSLAYARTLMEQRDAARIWSCALVDKPSRREVDITLDHVGFEVDDVFIVGYGIDYAEQYRHLPYIGVVE